jgi:3-dehydroquinate synthase
VLSQSDSSIGAKVAVNHPGAKNLIGSFYQPRIVITDPSLLATLPKREFSAGLGEAIKYGVIADPKMFEMLYQDVESVLGFNRVLLTDLITRCVRIKIQVVEEDERETGLRKILNFGHTIGHALEAETRYERLLHGEAIAFGMHAATRLAEKIGKLDVKSAAEIHDVVRRYGPIPALAGISADHLLARLASDKKTVKGKVHFVLPTKIGEVEIVSGIDPDTIREAIEAELAEAVAA